MSVKGGYQLIEEIILTAENKDVSFDKIRSKVDGLYERLESNNGKPILLSGVKMVFADGDENVIAGSQFTYLEKSTEMFIPISGLFLVNLSAKLVLLKVDSEDNVGLFVIPTV